MPYQPEELLDIHVPTAEELAPFIKHLRQENKWSQATLAELSRLTERTIQRVESGQQSTFDTRRALAVAFGFDMDFFNKPWPFPNVERLKAYTAELERTTASVSLGQIENGRALRTMMEGCHCSACDHIGDLPKGVAEAFAAIVDNLRDYNDVRDIYTEQQRLELDEQIDGFLEDIRQTGAAVAAGLRHMKLRQKDDPPDREAMAWTAIYLVVANAKVLPSMIRVPKGVQLG